MIAPDAPFPTTAASSPGEFKEAYEAAFAAGAEAIVSIHVAGTLSGTIKSAQIARDMLPDREIHVVDSLGASMAEGILARMARRARRRRARRPRRSPRSSRRGRRDMRMYVALETLEYLKKGGRISGAQAAIGTLLSVKPIIAVKHGVVETVDQVRTRGKARERLIELICERPIERLAILHTISPDVEAFRDEVMARAPGGSTRPDVTIEPRRRVGRAAPRPGLRRRGGPVPGLTRRPARAVAADVAARLRQRCRPVPSGRRESRDRGYTPAADEVARQPPITVRQDPAARPVGSSGRRPEPTAVDVTARHVRSSIP